MAKVKFMQMEYKKRDLGSYISGELKRQGKKQSDLGKVWRVSQQSVSNKLKTGRYTYDELVNVFTFLKTPAELRAEFMTIGG